VTTANPGSPTPAKVVSRTTEPPAQPTPPAPPGPSGEPAWMAEDLDKASAAIARSEFAQAIGLLKNICKEGSEQPSQARAAALLKNLETTAASRLEQVRDLEGRGRIPEAIQAAQELARQFAGLGPAAEGLELLTRLNARLDDKQRERMKTAQALIAQAREDFQTQQYLTCLFRCEELMARYSELPESSEASELAARIKSNPEYLQKMCDAVPEVLGLVYLTTAEAKIKQGEPQQAVFFLERILQAFPNSRHAEMAQVRLSQIQGPPPVTGDEKKQ
jgi:tetratricopeptide (TPR) repeat protein